MRAAIAGAAVLIAASLCFAQESKTYSASEAAKHVGETATVADKVANVFESKAGNTFLNFGARYLPPDRPIPRARARRLAGSIPFTVSSEKETAQHRENLRKNSLDNYKSAALPTELCRRQRKS